MQGSLPAGWLAFTGRELNPLDRYKRFQITFSFPFSGFILAQGRLAFQAVPSWVISGLSLLPAFAVRHPVCIRPSCTSWSRRLSRTAPGRGLDDAPPCGGILHLPQGPSLGSGLFCPGPSSLNRPHPPHSQAHRDFTAWRLIRDAFAVRERLGDPRVVPSFRCSSLPGMPPSPTPGSPTSLCSRTSMPTWPSPFDHRLGTPDIPAIRFTREADFVASLVRFRYGLPGCSPPCTDQTGTSSPRGLLLPGFQRIGLPPRCWL
jgi:hypothetical protein